MTPRSWFWAYRPTVPSARAQSVQVVNAAHAMATAGHEVELCVEGATDPASALAAYGLRPVERLRLVCLPPSRTLASLAYRARLAEFTRRTRGEGVVLARRKRHAAWALRWLRGRFHLLVEAHEVDSAQLAEQGRDPSEALALERRVLRGARGVVCNAPGTLRLLRRVHPWLPPAIVLHNGARPGVAPSQDAVGIGVLGSVRPDKDPWTVASAARLTRHRVSWIGVDRDRDELLRLSEGFLVAEPPIEPARVPERAARCRVLLVPLSHGLFGDALTSPLKLWDALASGVPVVAADTPALRAVADGAALFYRPGDAAHLAATLDRACEDEALRAELVSAARGRARTWGQRARELAAFADRVLP